MPTIPQMHTDRRLSKCPMTVAASRSLPRTSPSGTLIKLVISTFAVIALRMSKDVYQVVEFEFFAQQNAGMVPWIWILTERKKGQVWPFVVALFFDCCFSLFPAPLDFGCLV